MKIFYCDIETTGLFPEKHEIADISFCLTDPFNPPENIITLKKTIDRKKIDPEAFKVNNIDIEKHLKNALCSQGFIAAILSKLPEGKLIFASWNTEFDFSFLRTLFFNHGLNIFDFFDYHTLNISSLITAHNLLFDPIKNNLEYLYKTLVGGTDNTFHSSRVDVDALVRLANYLLYRLRETGFLKGDREYINFQ